MRSSATTSRSRFVLNVLTPFARALELQPDLDLVFGAWLHAKMLACDWAGLDAAYGQLANAIAQGKKISAPFPVFATPVAQELQLKCAEIYTQVQAPADNRLSAIPPRPRHRRIRLGYFSTDFEITLWRLPELITHSEQEYEARALEIALDPHRHRQLKDKLAANRLTHPLFDTALFTRHIEAAFEAMCRRQEAGLAPDHIVVPAQ